MSTDKDWEKWGAKDPYFGVFSSEKFRKNQLNTNSKNDFFASGEAHVDRLFGLIDQVYSQQFQPSRTIDFGCGVGRLLIPLAKRSSHVVGIDISPSMIQEAKSNISDAEIKNVDFSISDGEFKNILGHFSLVHSFIVFQHIPWSRGRVIIQQLSRKVELNGYLAIHFLTATNHSGFVRALAHLRYKFPPIHFIWNLIKRRGFFEPPMQLHVYDLTTIIKDLTDIGFDTPICCDEPDMDGFKNIYLFARRKSIISSI